MSISATIPLDQFPAPPRNVHGWAGWGVWFGRLFLLPHVCIGAGLLLFLPFVIVWAGFGVQVTGHVVDGHISRSSKGSVSYKLDFVYDLNGVAYQDSQSVGQQAYHQLRPAPRNDMAPMPVTILHFNIGPLRYAGILDARSRASVFWRAFFFALFWNAIVSLFVWLLWIVPQRKKWLFTHGQATLAAISTKRKQRNRNSTSYLVKIAFEHPATHARLEREVAVNSKKDWEKLEIGQIVTALCHPTNLKRVAVAEFGPYQVITPG